MRMALRAISQGHRRAQARRRGAARVGGELSGDIRRRRGCDFRPRHRNRRHRRCQSQSLCRRLATPARSSGSSTSARSAPACTPIRSKTRWGSSPVRLPGSSCASNGTARARMARLRWHEVFVKRVTIGGQDRILALARDITGRKTAEEALRASEEQYHSMFNALDRWTGAVERRGRDRRYQSRAVADVRLQRWRVLRVAARQLHGPVVSPRVSAGASPPANRCTRK